jgi:beta-phosphoglucomutase family hydrolase
MEQAIQRLLERGTKGLIFDMDGTLVHNMHFHRQAWYAFLEKHGIDVVDEDFDRKNAGTILEIVPRFFEGVTDTAEIMRLGMEKEALYREIYRPHVNPLPGLREFLEAARKGGLKLALATAADQGNIDFTLEELGITGHFDAITGSEEVKKGKPDPEVFLISARKLGFGPAECIVFEDSHVGIQAGLAAGMEVIAMATTHTRAELNERPLLAILEDYNAIRRAELKRPS